jgi:hypothetical protein
MRVLRPPSAFAFAAFRLPCAQSFQMEKARLSKLAGEQAPALRDAAAQALEPTLHALIKQQRLEVLEEHRAAR